MASPRNFDRFKLDKSARKFAILIDPDKHEGDAFLDFINLVHKAKPDFILIGGSLIHKADLSETVKKVKSTTDIPVVLFPGHFSQLTNEVDAVLLLSLISGRNPELLIGQHVLAAPILKKLDVEVVSTGYMLIDGGRPTSVSYISNTNPIPHDKTDIALCTALAGEYLGLSTIYLDAGSGAERSVPNNMVRAVSRSIEIPLIVGGGIKKAEKVLQLWDSGANLVVIGNGLEEKYDLFEELSDIKSEVGKQ